VSFICVYLCGVCLCVCVCNVRVYVCVCDVCNVRVYVCVCVRVRARVWEGGTWNSPPASLCSKGLLMLYVCVMCVMCVCLCVCNVCNVRVYQGTSARAGAALINQILVLPVGQGQNLKG